MSLVQLLQAHQYDLVVRFKSGKNINGPLVLTAALATDFHRASGLRRNSWIALLESNLDDSFYKTCLSLRVSLTRCGILRHQTRGKLPLELFIRARLIRVIAKIVAKRQCPPFFLSSSPDDVNMMRVRPDEWPMEEWTE